MADKNGAIPDPIAAGQALATLNDWRAIMAVMMFVIVALICFIVWNQVTMSRLHKSIDKVSDALWALKLSLARARIAGEADDEMEKP